MKTETLDEPRNPCASYVGLHCTHVPLARVAHRVAGAALLWTRPPRRWLPWPARHIEGEQRVGSTA